jgi:transforming growth factor-beta-induced protein
MRDVATVTKVLKYHVISSSVPSSALRSSQTAVTLLGEELKVTKSNAGVLVNDIAKVVMADVLASNGVVHVIDTLLVPPSLLPSEEAKQMSIVETAVATRALSTLVTVLTLPDYAGVLTALSSAGPFTVFAPTDKAFANAGVNVSDVEMVTEVLKYHVIAGAIVSSALQPSQSVATLQGEEVVVTKDDSGIFVNGNAKVVMIDIMASNGVVHVVDTLLLPPSLVALAAEAGDDAKMEEASELKLDASGGHAIESYTYLSVASLVGACALMWQ